MTKFLFKSIILILPVLFMTMFFILLTDKESFPGANYSISNLPEFQLENLQEDLLINEGDLSGSYILNIWASWCITCLVEHPYLMNLKEQGIKIVGLNYKDEKEDAITWLKKYGDPYEIIIHDFKGSLALDLGVTGAPETFLINDGIIVAHYQGEINDVIWTNVFLPIIEKRRMF
ncbi:MAG: DsbE family thiol:disulfide interchange protein [Gammaproteobacteria bacterium]|nr:DsbE family thiol:disulfide interchange protein [Gammaproteobacteria bacterium]|tara:strand:- start:4936 stop:5460 length:525 start_codon:yes stop_codon:yes gene_type:complete